MADTSSSVIRRYLQDAITAESSFETQLRGFAGEGDDEDVQLLFADHADQTHSQRERLTTRLEAMGGSASATKSFLAHFFSSTSKTTQTGHGVEERTVQNLVIAYTVEQGECAMYQALVAAAEAAGDHETQSLVQGIQEEERLAAERIWHLIYTRAKIAFNVATAGEVDPSLETRTAADRIV